MARAPKSELAAPELRGWEAIAVFLGMPQSTVHRWAKEGMPVRRVGRNVVATPEELNGWLQRSSGESTGTRVATAEGDLIKDLRASVEAKRQSRTRSSRLKKSAR